MVILGLMVYTKRRKVLSRRVNYLQFLDLSFDRQIPPSYLRLSMLYRTIAWVPITFTYMRHYINCPPELTIYTC